MQYRRFYSVKNPDTFVYIIVKKADTEKQGKQAWHIAWHIACISKDRAILNKEKEKSQLIAGLCY
jgi:hypothetical protein